MLDQNTLQQLRQLKKDIEDNKDQGEGEVRGSQRRFGFVRLDDGRDVFLPPETMQRVFPGDRVKVNVLTDDKGKFKGELEKLIDSPLKEFTGRYVVRGQGHWPISARLCSSISIIVTGFFCGGGISRGLVCW